MSDLVRLSWLFSILNYIAYDKIDKAKKRISDPLVVIGIPTFLVLLLLFFGFSVLTYLTCFSSYEQNAYGHFFGTTDTTLSGAKNQTAGNYVVELLLNPSKPIVGKDISFLMQVKSTTGDVLIELPVSFYILKDGRPVYSNANNYTMVSQGHHDFNYTFNEPGKYTLYVDINDIFYTLGVLSVNFDIDVQAPVLERISSLITTFIMNYYYIYTPLIGIIVLSYIVRLKRHGNVKKIP